MGASIAPTGLQSVARAAGWAKERSPCTCSTTRTASRSSFSRSPSPAPVRGPRERASRGAFEIVDKFARKDIFIEGAMADRFQEGVEALMEGVDGPSEEDMDEYIGRFASLMPQPLVIH